MFARNILLRSGLASADRGGRHSRGRSRGRDCSDAFKECLSGPWGTFCFASWCGTEVAVRTLEDDVIVDEDKGNLCELLTRKGALKPSIAVQLAVDIARKGALKPSIAVQLAVDIARGMNCLHEHKPKAIIHRDLEPSNILRDDTGHLKVANFGLSKILKYTKTDKEDRPMIEGCPPFSSIPVESVPKAYCRNERSPFNAPSKNYAHGLKELIEHCWSGKPSARPSFRYIINRLEEIDGYLGQKRKWKEGAFDTLPVPGVDLETKNLQRK
ncbi:Serine/threonine-protein kinase 12-like protein [Drosera capensis]